MTQNVWQLLSVSWDGTNLKLYRDGVDPTPATPLDNACTQTDNMYRVSIGADIVSGNIAGGRYHSVAVWDSALTSGEMLAIYNSGDGEGFDLSTDSGSYTSSSDLVRWWRLGLDSTDIGKDYVDDNVDVMDDAANITSGDIVTDSPT